MARSSGRRTDYTWQGAFSSIGVAANATAVAAIGGALNVSATLTRCHGEILASIDGPVATDALVVGLGLMVVTEEQLAVGATAIPNPSDDLDADWFWHGFIPLSSQGSVQDQQNNVGRLTVDSKAMRKMKQTMSIALVIDNGTLTGTPAIDVSFGIRNLFGL